MRRFVLIGLGALSAAQVSATGLGLKPGLWESKIVRQVVDGRDATAQMSDAMAKMQQALASMPPEQRERMEAMMKQRGTPTMTEKGAVRMCVVPEQAQARPAAEAKAHCAPADVSHSGNHTTFNFNCSNNGVTTTGKGEVVNDGNVTTTTVDVTTRKADGSMHVMHNESQMTYLGSECGDVKPFSVLDGWN